MKKTLSFILFLFLFLTCAEGQMLMLDSMQVKEDLRVFNLAIESHPGLHIHRTKNEISKWKEEINQLVTDSISIDAFYLKLLETLVYIQDGHTGLSLGEKYGPLKKTNYILPFKYKILYDKLYTIHDFSTSKKIPLFSEIVEINGVKVSDALTVMYEYTTSDGGNLIFKQRYNEQIFGRNFAFFFQANEKYNLKCKTPTGDTVSYEVKGIPNLEELKKKIETIPLEMEIREKDDLAILTINTFLYRRIVDSGKDFHQFIDSFFKQVRKKGINNIIIDVRKNYGGSSTLAMTLFAYISENDFKWIDHSIAMISCNETLAQYTQYPNGDYPILKSHDLIKVDSIFYYVTNGIESKKNNSSTEIPFGPKMKIKNISRNKFYGNTYVLTSGMTFSAGAIFASKCASKKHTVIIGEVIGGAKNVFCGGGYLHVTLPNSRFVFQLPIMRRHFALDNSTISSSTCLIPDYRIEYEMNDLIIGNDKEVEKVLEILNKK